MQKLFFIILCIWINAQLYAQSKLPIIKATSLKVDIRVGDDYFSKGGWNIEPSKNPDVFSIGSKWYYDTKKVTFITDIDSISFDVQPGHKYDFVILLNSNISCFTEINALANPLFFSKYIVIIIFIGFGILLSLLYLNRNRIKAKTFLKFGYVAPFLFWVITFVSGYIHGNYNHFKNTISELGAIGTDSELFTSSSLLLIAIACILFSVGFYKASKVQKISKLPAILTLSMPFTIIWASIFTLGNEFHSATGPIPFLITLGCLLAYFLWKKKKDLLQLRTISLVSFFVMLLILTRFIEPFGHEYEGLVQRFFYLGWTVWTIATSYYLSKEMKVL